MVNKVQNQSNLMWKLFEKTGKFVKASIKVLSVKFPDIIQATELCMTGLAWFELRDGVDAVGKLPAQVVKTKNVVMNCEWGKSLRETLETAFQAACIVDGAATVLGALESWGTAKVPENLASFAKSLAPPILFYTAAKGAGDAYNVYQEMKIHEDAYKEAFVSVSTLQTNEGTFSKTKVFYSSENNVKHTKMIESKANELYPDNEDKRKRMVDTATKIQNSQNKTEALKKVGSDLKREVVLGGLNAVGSAAMGVALVAVPMMPLSAAAVATTLNAVNWVQKGISFGKVAVELTVAVRDQMEADAEVASSA